MAYLPITYEPRIYDEIPNICSIACLAVCMDRRLKPYTCYVHLGKWGISILVFTFLFVYFNCVPCVKYLAIAARVRFSIGKNTLG